MAYRCVLFCFIATTISNNITWQYSASSTSLLPYSYATFYGYDGDSIFILGGYSYATRLVEYNTALDTYTDHANSITFGAQNAQSVAQMGSIIYMWPYDSVQITAYDLGTLTVVDSLTYPSNIQQGCLVSFDNIYIIGIGGSVGNVVSGSVHIYNTTDSLWTSAVSLPTPRLRHSCTVVGDQIYLFGGTNGNNLDDIWKFQWNGPWTQLNARLSKPRYDSRAVAFETDIYIIGGAQTSTISFNTVDVLDTITDNIWCVSSLIAAKYSAAVIVMENKNSIYVFGGYPFVTSTTSTRYQYAVIDTLSPTNTPTQYPTPSPTTPPTIYPTDSPVVSPTAQPTSSPTVSPTYSPLLTPTLSPTKHPTAYPTQPPSNTPSISPTFAPSYWPTNYPTNNPSFWPTFPPTNAPTFSPTRFPTTVTEYNLQAAVILRISNVTQKDIVQLLKLQQIKTQIIPMVETNYVRTDNKIEYRDFEIKADAVQQINDLNPILAVNITGFVRYRMVSFIDLFSYTCNHPTFINNTQHDLYNYFHNESVHFYMYVNDTKVYEIAYTRPIDVVFYSLMGMVGISVIISMIAFVYNKKDNSKVDDADYLSICNVGLNSFDLISDILLSSEIIQQFENNDHDHVKHKWFLYIAAMSSIIFVIVPYLINIAIVIKIEAFVSGNKAASLYFKQYRGLFVLLMLFTGSADCALKLLSSRIYGLDLCNSGLTKYELSKLSHLRLFGRVLIGNLPQLIFVQVLYTIYSGQLLQTIILSFVASFLSMLAASISYLLQCRVSDCHIVQYELEINSTHINPVLSNQQIAAVSHSKECKKRLGKSLSAALNVEFRAIEFGFVKLTNVGLIINMIHYVFKSDLLNRHDSSCNKWVYNLYQMKQNEVNTSFGNHFGFDVEVKCKNFDIKVSVTELKELNKFDKWSFAGKKMVTVISRIEILSSQNYSQDYIRQQLENEGYEKYVITSILSAYSHFSDENDNETRHPYSSLQNTNDYVLLND